MILTTRPIVRWPGELTKGRQHSLFSASWPSTLTLLDREIGHLRPKGGVVLQMAVSENDIRIDGQIKGNANPAHPGVILVLAGTKFGDLSYPCDTFWDWRDNVRAVALGLEALRRVERYGIANRGQQYAGWKELPPSGIELGAAPMTMDQAAAFIADHAGDDWNGGDLMWDVGQPQAESVERAYKLAAKRLHPDTGGDHDSFVRLRRAYELLVGAA